MRDDTHERRKRAYEAPAIVDLGTLHDLTLQVISKVTGSADTIIFNGQVIGEGSNAP